MLSLITLAAPPSFVVFGFDIGSAVPVIGSIVQWASLAASIVAIGFTARAAKRARVRDLRDQVSSVFIRRLFVEQQPPVRQTTIVNQSGQSIWDVVVIEQAPGQPPKRYKLQALGELRAGDRRTHTTHGADVEVTLIATDYQGRTWEMRADVITKWKPSKQDAQALHIDAFDAKSGE